MTPIPVPAFQWRSDAPDGDRHAFPQRDGFPPRSLCEAVRWTVRFGEHGLRWCDGCLAALKAMLSGATEALNEAKFANATGDLDQLAAAEACAFCTIDPEQCHADAFCEHRAWANHFCFGHQGEARPVHGPGHKHGDLVVADLDSPAGAGHLVEADRG